MKIEPINSDKTEIHALKQIEKKRVLDERKPILPNQRVFEYNTITKEIKEANYKHAATFGNGYTRSIDKQSHCIYIIALNKKNALKKIKLPR